MLTWPRTLQPYLKSCPVLHCSSDATALTPMVPSYWMNSNLNEKSGRGVKTTDVDRPARTFLMGDGDPKPISVLNEKSWNPKASYAERHMFGANYAFVDGHVKWYSSEDVAKFQFKAPCCTLHSWQLKVLK